MVKEKGQLMPREFINTQDRRIKKRGDVYYAVFKKNGQRVVKSLNTSNFKVAKRLTDDIENTILLGLNWKRDKELIEEAWPEFLIDKAKGIKTVKARPSTIKHYIHTADRYLLPFWGDKRFSEIDDSLWDDYITFSRDLSGNPNLKIFNHRKYFLAFLNWAQKRGKIQEVPDLHNPDIEPDDGIGLVYTDEQLEAMREAAPMPFKLAVFMAQYMGMRRSEINQIPKSQVDIDKMIITLKPKDTKTNRGRKVPIHNAVLTYLKAQFKETEASPYLFPNRDDINRPMDRGGFKKVWKKLRDDLGIEGRFHDFRHTYLTKAFKNPNVPHLLICEAAGVSIKVAQDVYIHFSDKDLLIVSDEFEG